MNSLMHFLCQNAKNEMDLMFFFVVVIFSVSHLLLKFYFTLIHFINICISLISIDSLMLDCCIVLVYLMDFVLVVTLYLWNENKYTSTDQVLSIFDPFMLELMKKWNEIWPLLYWMRYASNYIYFSFSILIHISHRAGNRSVCIQYRHRYRCTVSLIALFGI